MINISLELFPVKSAQALTQLQQTVKELAVLPTDFISVTQNAGGSESHAAQESTLCALHGLAHLAPHVTCAGANREETTALIEAYIQKGLRQIVALRGDARQGTAGFQKLPNGFHDVLELIRTLRQYPQLDIHVAAYPETHPEALHAEADIDWLKRKFDAGADRAITQFFFDAETFLRFRDRCQKSGITQTIIPGILPIHDFAAVTRFADKAGIAVPLSLQTQYANCTDHHALSIETSTRLCARLIHAGVDHLHFYTMNRAGLILDIAERLELVPAVKTRKSA